MANNVDPRVHGTTDFDLDRVESVKAHPLPAGCRDRGRGGGSVDSRWVQSGQPERDGRHAREAEPVSREVALG
jgi:hypothetical protein